MVTWYSVDTAGEQNRLVAAWPDAPIENLEVCGLLLEAAEDQVLAYAPVLAEGATIPNRWVAAQLQQAKNLWDAGRVSTGGDAGVDGFSFTPRPLDKTIRQLIRPVDGKPHVL